MLKSRILIGNLLPIELDIGYIFLLSEHCRDKF